VALLLRTKTSADQESEETGWGDSAWAGSSSSARWSSGRAITDETPSNRAEQAPSSAEETSRWAVSCQRGYGVRGGEGHNYIGVFASKAQGKQSAPSTRIWPVRLFTGIADFRWLARESRTLNVHWMGILGLPLRRMKGRTNLRGLRWNISCHQAGQVRSCKNKCRGPAVSTKIPWSAEKIAAKFPSWVECTTCSNDLLGRRGWSEEPIGC
jgi:hypothetical protein